MDHRCLSISDVQLTWIFFEEMMPSGTSFLAISVHCFDLLFLIEANLKGSGASLSVLVQLPSPARYDVKLPLLEASEESESSEQADMGRAMLSPRSLDVLSQLLTIWY